ncbi:MAG: transcriptional repressor [Muribaculaceae bacterium]|nr:transcriptional repressor [Muribaculaceae bacterium]
MDKTSRSVEQVLTEAGVSPTPVRILVWKCLEEAEGPLSMAGIEEKLESVDKSTISRTLSTFRRHNLLHHFYDGSGSLKYELCHSHDHQKENDTHVHFRCEVCGETKCITQIPVPLVALPEGYEFHSVNYVITGICKDCYRQK